MAEHFYPQAHLAAPQDPGFNIGAFPQNQRPSNYAIPVAVPEKAPGLGSILAQSFGQGLGGGLGSGLSEGIQSSIKTAMNQKLIDRAIGGLGPKATAKDIFAVASQLPPDAQQLFVKTYMPAKEQESMTERQRILSQAPLKKAEYTAQQNINKTAALEEGRNQRARTASQDKKQNTFSNLINKDTSLPSDIKDEAVKIGSEFLDKGASPTQAYAIGKQIAAQRVSDKNELKNLDGPSKWFTSKNTSLMKDAKIVASIKKNKLLDDDEIAIALLKKGYTPQDIQSKFRLKLSKELLNASPEEQQTIMQEVAQSNQQVPEQETVKGKPLTPEYMQDVMMRAGGDPDKAAAIAESEGYNVPKQ